MVLPVFLLIVVGGVALLYRTVSGRRASGSAWRTALVLGVPLGVVRASLACLGWYVVEHTGGPAQVPAFALAMLAWPEGALLPEPAPGMTPVRTYVLLFLLLVASTTTLVAVLAVIAAGQGRAGSHRR
jgi:hypothetical protein